MKKVFFLALSLILISIFSNNLYSQSKSDVCDGNFTLTSYDLGDYNDYDDCYNVEFSDGLYGKLYYSESCGKYYIFGGGFYKLYYSNQTMGLKALYAYKKYSCEMEGDVDCD